MAACSGPARGDGKRELELDPLARALRRAAVPGAVSDPLVAGWFRRLAEGDGPDGLDADADDAVDDAARGGDGRC
jgi:hypothetical protein